MRAVILLTCFNRKGKTIKCIRKLADSNTADMDFVVVDDGSSDGTWESLQELEHVFLIRGDGKLYYSGGMRKAMEYAKANLKADYYMLVNDDVEFFPGVIDRLANLDEHIVYVGAMQNAAGQCSYGGIKYVSGIHYKTVQPTDDDRSCDTFNANFVAVPRAAFEAVPSMDGNYRHSLGDFDYGLSIKRDGIKIQVLDFYAGICENNPATGTWMDTTLPRMERLRLKESVKGAPFKQWFYFLKKNFGLGYAVIYSVTPFLRIMMGE